MKKTLCAAILATSLGLLAACGGSESSDRPSRDDIIKGLLAGQEETEQTKKQAECAADIILDSELSPETLSALAKGQSDFEPSAKDKEVQEKMTDKILECMK
jgi:ABC-type phosphate/phosphonate transport system substrate-binding protein